MIFIDKVVRQLSKQMSTEYISGYLLLERAFSVQKRKIVTQSLRKMLELNVYVQANEKKQKENITTSIFCDINNLC